MNRRFDFKEDEMLIRTPPCGWRHVTHMEGAKVEDDDYAPE